MDIDVYLLSILFICDNVGDLIRKCKKIVQVLELF